MSGSGKTGLKSGIKTAKSPKGGAELPLGAHPGNTGGKKGRSGRKPQDFVQWCKDLLADENVRRMAEARAKSGDTKILELAAKYSHAPPAQSHKVETTLVIKAVRE